MFFPVFVLFGVRSHHVGDVGRPVRTESQSQVSFGKDQQHLRVMTIESTVAAAWHATLDKQEETNSSETDTSVFSHEESRRDVQHSSSRSCIIDQLQRWAPPTTPEPWNWMKEPVPSMILMVERFVPT